MSYIPDIRDKYEPDFRCNKTDAEKQENAYYQGYLNEKDAEYLAGFDYAVEDTLESFCYNLDIYEDDILESCEIDFDAFRDAFSTFIEREYTDDELDLDTIDDKQIRLILALFRAFQHYAEMERDEMGTSLIENMEEADYDECRRKCKEGYKNILLRIEDAKEKELEKSKKIEE